MGHRSRVIWGSTGIGSHCIAMLDRQLYSGATGVGSHWDLISARQLGCGPSGSTHGGYGLNPNRGKNIPIVTLLSLTKDGKMFYVGSAPNQGISTYQNICLRIVTLLLEGAFAMSIVPQTCTGYTVGYANTVLLTLNPLHFVLNPVMHQKIGRGFLLLWRYSTFGSCTLPSHYLQPVQHVVHLGQHTAV